MTDFIKKFKTTVSDLLFTVKCPYCGKVINRNSYACDECKSIFPETSIVKYAVGGYKCAVSFPYSGIFKRAVKVFKFKNCGVYAKQLSFMIVTSINEIYKGEKFDLITCVPMHRKALKERGYNQAELLARECAVLMDIPYIETLEKYKENKTQHSIKAKERAKNVKGVYRIIDKQLVYDKNILIIDDIITTGNTLGECARILIKSGCSKLSCAALCTVITN